MVGVTAPFLVSLLSLVVTPGAPAAATPARSPVRLDPRALVARLDDMYRGGASHGRMAMSVVTDHVHRTFELETWTEGADRAVVRVTSPGRLQGVETLMLGPDAWRFFPEGRRLVALPASAIGGPWMGTDFTIADLVGAGRAFEDCSFETPPSTRPDEAVIVASPKQTAAAPWSKLVLTVRRADLLPLSIAYYDQVGRLSRTLTFQAPTRIGGREIPSVIRVTPADKPGQFTELRYSSLTFDPKIPLDFFSTRYLQRRRGGPP